MKYSDMQHVRHPPQNQVIDRIIDNMTARSPYVFDVLWGKAFEVHEIEKNQNKRELKLCFDKMIKEDLIKSGSTIDSSYGNNWHVKVMLTDKGEQIRESGGWLAYLEQQRIKLDFWDRVAKPLNIVLVILLIIATPTGLWLQSKSNTLELENKDLAQKLQESESTSQSLRDEIKKKDDLILFLSASPYKTK